MSVATSASVKICFSDGRRTDMSDRESEVDERRNGPYGRIAMRSAGFPGGGKISHGNSANIGPFAVHPLLESLPDHVRLHGEVVYAVYVHRDAESGSVDRNFDHA